MATETMRMLALDQGTTSTRAMVFDAAGKLIVSHAVGFRQYYPQPGWVSHDAEEIWQTVLTCLREVCAKARVSLTSFDSFGITNQRESIVVWDKHTGKPIDLAICWQCRRTADRLRRLEAEGLGERIRELTGLPLDAYFSASKIEWLLDEIPGARARAEAGDLLAGTIDSFLIWRLTDGRSHYTDVSNASRTMLMNIETCDWDEELLEIFHIPRSLLPEIKASACDFGEVSYQGLLHWAAGPTIEGRRQDYDAVDRSFTPGVFGTGSLKITGVAGDQQAALFGQRCFAPGEMKATYGTGGFVLANVGPELIRSRHQLVETVAWDIGHGPIYALEGSVFNAGSAIQWLRDELGLIERSADCEHLAKQVEDTNGVCFVSAFTGLGAPYWDMDARGTLVGLTRGTRREHICRAVLEGIAYQTADVITAIHHDIDQSLDIGSSEIRVDGGASQADLMLQFQADLVDVPIYRPAQIDTTALGAAYLSALGAGLWQQAEEIAAHEDDGVRFVPQFTESKRSAKLAEWNRAIATTQAWSHYVDEVPDA